VSYGNNAPGEKKKKKKRKHVKARGRTPGQTAKESRHQGWTQTADEQRKTREERKPGGLKKVQGKKRAKGPNCQDG